MPDQAHIFANVGAALYEEARMCEERRDERLDQAFRAFVRSATFSSKSHTRNGTAADILMDSSSWLDVLDIALKRKRRSDPLPPVLMGGHCLGKCRELSPQAFAEAVMICF